MYVPYWYQITPVGHNSLQQTVHRFYESAGFNGHLIIEQKEKYKDFDTAFQFVYMAFAINIHN